MKQSYLTLSKIPRIGFVSSYPPTKCGLATFTESLVSATKKLRGDCNSIKIVRVVNELENLNYHDDNILSYMDPNHKELIIESADSININLDIIGY